MHRPMVNKLRTGLGFPKRDFGAFKSLFTPTKSVFPTGAFTPSRTYNKLFLNRIV